MAAPLPPSRCPLGHDRKGAPAPERTEPADTPDRPVAHAKKVEPVVSSDPLDMVPDVAIPATGRGNSDDGSRWLNPSPRQLANALHNRGKPIAAEDTPAVGKVHEMVVSE